MLFASPPDFHHWSYPPASTPWLGTPRLLGDRTADNLPT
jgi:hypothetical protein